MKKLIKLAVLLPITAIVLTACLATTYKFGNATYNNREEAMAAAMRDDAEADAAIPSGNKPLVDRKLLIVMPTASAFSKTVEARVLKQGKQYAAPGTPARAQDDFMADILVANMKSLTSSINRAKIYREIEVLDVDTTTPNIQPSPLHDVLVLNYFGQDSGAAMVYFISPRFGKQIVAADMGKALKGDRRKSIIDDLKSKALQ